MRARAVIGASYGDEGKGRTVDWLAAPHGPAALVVRSNGGAQAGHTVLLADGTRHVFHHLGSGTLRGSRTHLSRFMVSHPILFGAEQTTLARMGMDAKVTADPRGFVTTPFDMMVNQAIEQARGGGRHGSCGLGFGETVQRCEQTPFPLTIADLHGADLRPRVTAIRDEWLAMRLGELGLDASAGALEFARSDLLLDRFLGECVAFAAAVALRGDGDIGGEPAIVFEAAQGLLLDQYADGFPFLTRSSTGLTNIAAIAAEAGLDAVEPIYATRCYLTRHGRGPMEDERPIDAWFAVDDPTNRPNPWQESLRFGLLDPAALGRRIAADLAGCPIARGAALAVSCLDQASGALAWLDAGQVHTGPAEMFLESLEAATALPIGAAYDAPCNAWPEAGTGRAR